MHCVLSDAEAVTSLLLGCFWLHRKKETREDSFDWFCIPRRNRHLSIQIGRCLDNLALRMAGTSPYSNQNAESSTHLQGT